MKDNPNNLYEKSEKPHAINIDYFQRLQLFIRRTEHKISHGQITICRSGNKYEYQLPAEFSGKYNNQTVGVRYDNFNEICLYELDTDKPICIVREKPAIHGALANQTDLDREYLLKNKGRIKGIETQSRKRMEKIFSVANADNTDAFERVNKRTNSKDVISEIRGSAILRAEFYEQFGTNINTVTAIPKVNENLNPALRPQRKEKRHPFQRTGTMEKMIIDM